MKVTVMPIVVGALGTIPIGFAKGTRRLGNLWTSRDHSSYSIIKIGQNTKKSPGDLRRLDVTQTPVRNHQLTIV